MHVQRPTSIAILFALTGKLFFSTILASAQHFCSSVVNKACFPTLLVNADAHNRSLISRKWVNPIFCQHKKQRFAHFSQVNNNQSLRR